MGKLTKVLKMLLLLQSGFQLTLYHYQKPASYVAAKNAYPVYSPSIREPLEQSLYQIVIIVS